VINPGTETDEEYLTTADIIVTFEGPYESYAALQFPATRWEWSYPADRFWHLVHATAAADMPDAVALSQQRNVGWVYVTPDALPNPWDTLPPASYWSGLLDAAANVGPDRACQAPFLRPQGPDASALRGTVIGDGVNFRVAPGLACDVIRTFAAGESVRILDGTADVDGYSWQRVADDDGVEGWVVSDFIEVHDDEVKPTG
jgi:hypothetical protein